MIISNAAAIEVLQRHGAHISRALFYQSLRPKLEALGIAREIAPRVWSFDEIALQHWSRYLAIVQRRRAEGSLPGNYEYDEWDCQLVTDGAWEEWE